MSSEWENGNAARDPSYEDSRNPFAPIDYAGRLRQSAPKPMHDSGMSYTPGQLYGYRPAEPSETSDTPWQMPEAAWTEADPTPFPPQDAQAGALYNTALFRHQQTAVMPSSMDETPFADRGDFSLPPWPEAPQYEPAEPVESNAWRDPFTPAAPKAEETSAQPSKPQPPKASPAPRARIRVGRLVALILSVGMVIFCIFTLVSMMTELMESEKTLDSARSAYREENHTELQSGAARVDLLPAGQTFAPTATPSATPYTASPTPTPIIPIREAAVASLGRSGGEEVTADEPTASPVQRTRQTTYPKNPMRNIQESLTLLVAQNSDVIGRLVIPNVLDEIVVQRNNTYYLTRDYLGVTREGGSVFADEGCSLRTPPENLLLRGQGSVPNQTFAPLWQYVSGGAAFASSAAVAQLTTLYEEESYVLFAVIVADSDPQSEGYFNYASHPSFDTDEAMLRYVQEARAHSLYTFDVEVQSSDRLLTLATIGSDNCLVLLFKQGLRP